jgi:hypothetical protein
MAEQWWKMDESRRSSRVRGCWIDWGASARLGHEWERTSVCGLRLAWACVGLSQTCSWLSRLTDCPVRVMNSSAIHHLGWWTRDPSLGPDRPTNQPSRVWPHVTLHFVHPTPHTSWSHAPHPAQFRTQNWWSREPPRLSRSSLTTQKWLSNLAND